MTRSRSESTAKRSVMLRSSTRIPAVTPLASRHCSPRRRRSAPHVYPADVRYRERSTVERVNGRLKDEFGARHVRVRGHAKVLCHLMFGIVALTVDQLLRMLN